MKKNIKKGFICSSLLFAALAAFWIIDRFYIGAAKAEEKIAAYEQAQYMHPETVDMEYDWYSGGGYIGENYRYLPQKDLIIDEERNELWYKYFEREMEAIATSMNTNVLLEEYSLITYYDGNDANISYDDLFLYGVYNTQPVEEEERIAVGTEIIWNILAALDVDYNLCGIHIDYYDLSGVYRFSINLGKEKITKEMLAASVKEVSFTDNALIEEKWQDFCSMRKTFWTIPCKGYEIALVGMEEYGDYQLVQRVDGEESFLKTYQRYVTNPEKYLYGVFENIMGYEGFYIYEVKHYFTDGEYYVLENNELVQIAESFGNTPEDCYTVDINNDGVTEFICNVMYGTGGKDATIYYKDGSQILCGSGSDLAEIDVENVISKSINSYYIPEENAVYVSYMLIDDTEYREGIYAIDFEKLDFYPFNMQGE